jgi:hypothetical protein
MEGNLESERIGLIGEQQFQLLCAQAGLLCNKSTVDVMGWDFIVEFPVERFGGRLTLDQRQARAVRVQLKPVFGRQAREGSAPLRHRCLPNEPGRKIAVWLSGSSHRR